MAAAPAEERRLLRLVFAAFPGASVPVSAVFALILGAPEFSPVTVLWGLGLGLAISLAWPVAVWWPLRRWFLRNGFAGLVLVPSMAAAGALLCLPFIVLSPVLGGMFLPMLTGLFGTAVGAIGSLAGAAVEGARRLRCID
ncbi:hypothetical protein HER39_13950 [Arthrobacter deserti]|uniref:Uncharacterized protein n=1 Tax=Arthrobacter deserti TaxID=1742687 RepID=A0ABX1JV26_9MICC|nr:hypothetical protein [Arthrobacter deserti]